MARSNNNNKLKAYVRFDGSGRVVSSSLIVQAFKPKVGNWKEIDAKECCNYVPTTTTSTTVAPTTTTTTTTSLFPLSICVSVTNPDLSIVSGEVLFTELDGNGYPQYSGSIFDPNVPYTYPAGFMYNPGFAPETWWFFSDINGGLNGSVSEVTTVLNPLLVIYDNPNTSFIEGPCI